MLTKLTKRAHYDLRIAHANGEEIELLDPEMDSWMGIDNPSFVESCTYRIKPKEDRIFPTTTLSGDFFRSLFIIQPSANDFEILTIANAAIKQYILDSEH